MWSEIPVDNSQQRHKAVSSMSAEASSFLDEMKRKLFYFVKLASLHTCLLVNYTGILMDKLFSGGERRVKDCSCWKEGRKKVLSVKKESYKRSQHADSKLQEPHL